MKTVKNFLALVILASMLLAACQPAAPAAPAAPAEQPGAAPAEKPTDIPAPTAAPTTDPNAVVPGGKIVIGTPQEPGVLNPLLQASSVEDWVSAMVIEGLVLVDPAGKYQPVLAKELPVASEDGLTITWKLKEGVKFSDGSDFNCEDVKFTLDAVLSDASQASTSGYKDIETLTCVDPFTVEAKFAKIYAPFMRLFNFVLPDNAGKLEDLDNWAFNRAPIGTGPWVLKEWKAGDQIVLEKNATFREEGKPYLDSVIIKILPSRETGMQLLGTGEINVLWDLVESDFPSLEKLADKNVGYAGAVTGENELLLLNFGVADGSAPADASKAPHPILSDVKVREALQIATDKQAIVDALLSGNVKIGSTVLPAGDFACPQEPSVYDLDKAAALLDEAGWKMGSDNVREKDGVKLELKITSSSGNQLREQTEQVLQKMWEPLGVKLVIENVPSDTLFAGWSSGGLRKVGKFDILLYTTGPFGGDPDSHLFSNYHSLSIPSKDNEGSGSNYSRYNNPDVDAWLDEASTTTDMAKRAELYCKAASQINKDIPRIFLYERLLLSGYNKTLQNFQISPSFVDLSWDTQNWWLKK